MQQFQHYHTGKLILSECKSATKHFIAAVFLYSNYTVVSKHMQVYVFLFTFAATKTTKYSLNWSKEDMSAAASREIPMTKQVTNSLATLGEATKKSLSSSWWGLPCYF